MLGDGTRRNLRKMDRQQFEQEVAHAIEQVPRDIRRQIANVAIVVEDLPDDTTMDMAEVDDPYELFGFYHGVPLTQRTHNYGLISPDKISIFRKPILAVCNSDDEARAMIRRTLRHELAHYFGIDDDRLEELGAY
jgi:predicted Zn-dependent protease with MMP-like domain